MVDRLQIQPGMEVLASDGAPVGRVEAVEGQTIRLMQAVAAELPQVLPLEWVARIDRVVHLGVNRDALTRLKGGTVVSVEEVSPHPAGPNPPAVGVAAAAGAAGASIGVAAQRAGGHVDAAGPVRGGPAKPVIVPPPTGAAPSGAGAPPPRVTGAQPDAIAADDAGTPLPPIRNPAVKGARPRSNYYLPWMLALLGAILLLVLLVRACEPEREAEQIGTLTTTSAAPVTTDTSSRPAPLVTDLTTGTIAYELNAYLASGGTAERTFAFDRLNFRSGSARIRREDQEDLDDIARVLTAYPNARIAVVGYTDAAGSGETNVRLGFERATAIAGALAERGVAPERIAARSGGEQAPIAANEESEGRAENRRTELVVLTR